MLKIFTRLLIICLCVLSFQAALRPAAISSAAETSPLKESLFPLKIEADSILEINFDELTLAFPGLKLLGEIEGGKSDTLKATLDLLSDLNKQEVRVQVEEADSIRVYESYRTVLSVMNEGPHLDLYQWKGSESGWLPLRRENSGFFTKEISEEESRKFPAFSRKELSLAAETYGSKEWRELIENPTFGDWKEHYWIGVGLRRIKVDLYRGGEKSTRIIEFYIPMGC